MLTGKIDHDWTYTIYNDEFYTKQDIIITALDNVEARRYVDRYVLKIQVHRNCLCFVFTSFFIPIYWTITEFSDYSLHSYYISWTQNFWLFPL